MASLLRSERDKPRDIVAKMRQVELLLTECESIGEAPRMTADG
jgi:hypothetical protein